MGMAGGAFKGDMQRAQLDLQRAQIAQRQQQINQQNAQMAYARQQAEAERQRQAQAAQEAQNLAQRHGMASRKFAYDDMSGGGRQGQQGMQNQQMQTGLPQSSTYSNYDAVLGQNRVWNEYSEIDANYKNMLQQRQMDAQNHFTSFMLSARKNGGIASQATIGRFNEALGMDGKTKGVVAAGYTQDGNFFINSIVKDGNGQPKMSTEVLTPENQAGILGRAQGIPSDVLNDASSSIVNILKQGGKSTAQINKAFGRDIAASMSAQETANQLNQAQAKSNGAKQQSSVSNAEEVGKQLTNFDTMIQRVANSTSLNDAQKQQAVAQLEQKRLEYFMKSNGIEMGGGRDDVDPKLVERANKIPAGQVFQAPDGTRLRKEEDGSFTDVDAEEEKRRMTPHIRLGAYNYDFDEHGNMKRNDASFDETYDGYQKDIDALNNEVNEIVDRHNEVDANITVAEEEQNELLRRRKAIEYEYNAADEEVRSVTDRIKRNEDVKEYNANHRAKSHANYQRLADQFNQAVEQEYDRLSHSYQDMYGQSYLSSDKRYEMAEKLAAQKNRKLYDEMNAQLEQIGSDARVYAKNEKRYAQANEDLAGARDRLSKADGDRGNIGDIDKRIADLEEHLRLLRGERDEWVAKRKDNDARYKTLTHMSHAERRAKYGEKPQDEQKPTEQKPQDEQKPTEQKPQDEQKPTEREIHNILTTYQNRNASKEEREMARGALLQYATSIQKEIDDVNEELLSSNLDADELNELTDKLQRLKAEAKMYDPNEVDISMKKEDEAAKRRMLENDERSKKDREWRAKRAAEFERDNEIRRLRQENRPNKASSMNIRPIYD